MITISKEFTKEQLIEQARKNIEVLRGASDAAVIHLKLAEIALASLEAKSRKLFTCSGCGAEGLDEPLESKCHCNEDGAHWVESVVYTAPPAPVSVPDYPETLPCPVVLEPGLRFGKGVPTKTMLEALQRRAEYYAELEAMTPEQRAEHDAGMKEFAAMLQGAEPVATAYKLPDDFDFDRFNDVVWLEAVASNPHMHSPTTSTIAMVALELNKRLEPGNSPVIPDGWVACSERMPEQFKAILAFNEYGEVWSGAYDRCWNFYCDNLLVEHVTHWMPLPAAPQQEVK